jgi:hypothetical protein
MSQTLQALNSIIKYKNERERQKIDRSLSMMDMATRLRQQKIDNDRSERSFRLQESKEFREREKFKMLRKDRVSDVEYDKAIKKLNIDIKTQELISKELANEDDSQILKNKKQVEVDNNVKKLFAGMEYTNNQKADALIGLFPIKNLSDSISPITKNVVLDETFLNNVDNSIDDLENKKEKDFYKYLLKKDKNIISSLGIYNADPSLGRESVLKSLNNLVNMMDKESNSYDASLTSKFINYSNLSQDQLDNLVLSLDYTLGQINQTKNLKLNEQVQRSVYELQNKELTKPARIIQDRLIAERKLLDIPDNEEEYQRLLQLNPDLTPEEVFEGVPEQYLPDYYREIIK